ncbi:uncharacterized protein B0H18DRAFT_1080937 [Fomitopsis serialis]|uniref:uncharacterized protein n=1 Tax=Fomitopsis serialis TaxID=139415 RepID=UPI0020081EDD|nr:uncharacterized protein B0H18DRAFT_1080937 [Neoantrodia serialis]KAH9938173.1 hypothetical protein B0H18DRAFT_1080937 [Neoantrodia serialis]
MAPRRRCPICGSKQWHKEPSSGLITCREGHVLQNYRNETREVTELGPHALKKRALKSTRKKKEKESKADPRLYHGDRARYHYFQCLQLILRMQVAALIRLWGLPPEFEVSICLLPDPPPAEPLSAAQHSSDSPEPKPDQPHHEDLPDHRGSDDEGDPDKTAEPANSESSSSTSDEEDDPEMVELMRQAEEASSSSDEEEGTRSPYEKEDFGRKYDLPVNNLAVLVVACWTLRLPVTYMDFVRLVEAYDLPYLDPIRLLPESSALSPEHAPLVILLHGLAARLAKLMYSTYQVQIPEMNAAPTLWRAVRSLCGRVSTLYVLTKKVARVLSVPLTLHRTLASPLQRAKKKDPTWHKFDNAVPEVSLIATVIVVLKLVYGLDDKTRAPKERTDPACSLPRVDELLDCIKNLDDTAQEHHRFSATLPLARSVHDMDDNALDNYLAFCEKALLPLEDRTVERNAATTFFPLSLEDKERQEKTHTPTAEPTTLQATLLRAAHWCGVHDDYVAGVVERFERRLLRWWSRRTDREDAETDDQADEDGPV